MCVNNTGPGSGGLKSYLTSYGNTEEKTGLSYFFPYKLLTTPEELKKK